MKKTRFLFFLVCILFYYSRAVAQNPRSETPYLLPQTIFVGDPGRLVIPLGPEFSSMEPFVEETPGAFPGSPDLTIQRIELERRGGNVRLLIDFIPYAPGLLSIPPLDLVFPPDAPLLITDFSVQVASILDPSQMTLSEPASPLALPGTGLLVYGSIALILVVLSLGIGGSLWGRRHFREIWERIRRRYLLRNMAGFLRRLRQESGQEKSRDPAFYLTLLSGEFREFLSLFTGINCRPLSAGEFMKLPPDTAVLGPDFLCRLFRTWDTLRFSGRGIEPADLHSALNETEKYIAALDKAEKEKTFAQFSAGAAAEGSLSAGGAA